MASRVLLLNLVLAVPVIAQDYYDVQTEYPEQCGYNMHFENCVSVYRLTCANFSASVDPWYEYDNCTSGCVCDNGYLLDESIDQCVLPEYCPNIGYCPPNSVFEFCKQCDGYQTSCSDYGLPYPMYCPNECKSGCYCEGNYIFDEHTKECVPVEHCSCPENEYFEPCHLVTWPACWPGCTCISGYTYNPASSKCIPEPKPINTTSSYNNN